MAQLSEMQCVPCSGREPRATDEEIAQYRQQVPDWNIIERDGIPRLERTFSFNDYEKGLEFTTLVGQAANQQDHHPDILVQYKKVTVSWWTHAIKGLHRNDFVMAARTDEIYKWM